MNFEPAPPPLTWLTRMSPILLMMKPPSKTLPSNWLSFFLSSRRSRCCVWSSSRSSRTGKSFSNICCSSWTSFCRPLLYTSDMMRSVRTWCISVCISSAGHEGKWHSSLRHSHWHITSASHHRHFHLCVIPCMILLNNRFHSSEREQLHWWNRKRSSR